MRREDFRAQKILWSVVIVFAIFLYIARTVNQTYSILGGFGYFVAGGALFSPLGFLLLLLRLFHLLKKRDSFGYIFLATTLLALGLYNVYLTFTATAKTSFMSFFIFSIPLILGGCMYLDILIGSDKGIFTSSKNVKS